MIINVMLKLMAVKWQGSSCGLAVDDINNEGAETGTKKHWGALVTMVSL